MKNYLVTFTQNGEQRKDRTSNPMVFAMKLQQQAEATGASIEHLTFRREGCSL
jgi:hypothetical protein